MFSSAIRYSLVSVPLALSIIGCAAPSLLLEKSDWRPPRDRAPLSIDRKLAIARKFEDQGRTEIASRILQEVVQTEPQRQEAAERLVAILSSKSRTIGDSVLADQTHSNPETEIQLVGRFTTPPMIVSASVPKQISLPEIPTESETEDAIDVIQEEPDATGVRHVPPGALIPPVLDFGGFTQSVWNSSLSSDYPPRGLHDHFWDTLTFLQDQTYRYRTRNAAQSRMILQQTFYEPVRPTDHITYGYYSTHWRRFSESTAEVSFPLGEIIHPPEEIIIEEIDPAPLAVPPAPPSAP